MAITCSVLSATIMAAKIRTGLSRCSVGLVHEYMDKSIISKFYLHDIATIALTLSSKIDEIDKKIKSFTGSILELKKKDISGEIYFLL